jgi:superfamily II DNA or RNA helicase
MKITIETPIKAYISEFTREELGALQTALTYTNTSVQHLITRHHKNFFWKNSNLNTWEAHLKELKEDLKKRLIFGEDNFKRIFIRPGSLPYLADLFADLSIENLVKYPVPKKIPWLKPLPFLPHPEQTETWTKFIENRHANASLTTGFGKSAIILQICRELGLNCAIIAPGKGIFDELVEKFEFHFGKKYVGTFGDGKKKLGKKFTVCIGDSIANIKPGSEEYEFFSKLDVMIVDESHTFAAESLETICHGVLGNIPYRFFLSATQFRNDGSLPLLQSIIGPTVCELTTAEAIRKGYICPHDFRIVSLESSNPNANERDPLAQKRIHFLNNRNIAHFVAKLSNAMATAHGKQTLVLCEELTQLAMLAPLLTVPYALAHSEKRAARLTELGIEKVDVSESIEKFNKNEAKVLIATSCCHVGRNIFPCHSTVNWVGGASAIKTKQAAVGRSVRHGHSNPWAAKCVPKESSTIYDFDIENNPTMSRHLDARIECYRESETEIKYIRLKKN